MAQHASAGDLFQHVAFDERANVGDGYGNRQAGFVQRLERRAGFTPLRGSETVIAARLEGRQPIVVRVRADPDTRKIEADWRMRDLRKGRWAGDIEKYWDGPVYAVRSIIESDDRQFLDIMVESGVAA
jgi:head-tail adaptor